MDQQELKHLAYTGECVPTKWMVKRILASMYQSSKDFHTGLQTSSGESYNCGKQQQVRRMLADGLPVGTSQSNGCGYSIGTAANIEMGMRLSGMLLLALFEPS